MEHPESSALPPVAQPYHQAQTRRKVKTHARICLASASPRRQELLRQIGIAFEVVVPDVHEMRAAHESPLQYVQRVARDQARAGMDLMERQGQTPLPVLAADTEVVLDGEVLGKPRDRDAGMALLHRLAGRTHEVITGICLLHAGTAHEAVSTSRVTFGPLTDAQIMRYWETGEPADKAGGYGIQGMAAGFITHLDGSYSGVMGLPLYELAMTLRKTGIDWP